MDFFETLSAFWKECSRLEEGFQCLIDKGYAQCPIEAICSKKRDKLRELLEDMYLRFLPRNIDDTIKTRKEFTYLLRDLAREQDGWTDEYKYLKYCWKLSKLGLNSDNIEFLNSLGCPSFTTKLLVYIWEVVIVAKLEP